MRATRGASGRHGRPPPRHLIEGNIMKFALRRLVLASTVLAATASFTLPTFAQDVRREDSVTYYLQIEKIDANKDGMVSKKEFMDAMSHTWDMHMAEAKKADAKMPKDKMTLQQYLAFSKMFGLNVGG
jgi:hypothetical protein